MDEIFFAQNRTWSLFAYMQTKDKTINNNHKENKRESNIVHHKPHIPKSRKIVNYTPGTWFVDHFGQIFLLALDDRCNEIRLICVGDYCHPFIAGVSAHHIEIDHILMPGTILQITQPLKSDGGR